MFDFSRNSRVECDFWRRTSLWTEDSCHLLRWAIFTSVDVLTCTENDYYYYYYYYYVSKILEIYVHFSRAWNNYVVCWMQLCHFFINIGWATEYPFLRRFYLFFGVLFFNKEVVHQRFHHFIILIFPYALLIYHEGGSCLVIGEFLMKLGRFDDYRPLLIAINK